MIEVLTASTLGGFSSALRFQKYGYIHMLRIFIASVALGTFAGPDTSELIIQHSPIVISKVTACFIVAYCGSTILDRLILTLKAFQVSKKWNS